MGKASRDKGARAERDAVHFFESFLGLEAYRIPLSGAARGFKGDIVVPELFPGPIEVKYGNHVPSMPYKWLGNNAALIMRRKRQDALIVMRLKDFGELIRELNGTKEAS